MIKIMNYGQVSNNEIFARPVEKENVADTVSEILADVRANGDSALLRYCEKFDNASIEDGFTLEVSEKEIDEAFAAVDAAFIGVLERSAANIRAFHEKQVRNSFMISTELRPGVLIGQKVVPLDKVGIYVPGGTAAYPSSVLMNAIPAKIAGVKEIVMVTPSKGGKVNPVILAAAKIAGVTRIFKVGGAQAVAALAFGTESIPKVDKITGPGNAYVAEAKTQVFGTVAIDMVAGPSEILVVADGTCNPEFVAADMLSQAEHDKMASAVLITDSQELAGTVGCELERQIPALPRADIARASIDDYGKIIVAPDIRTAIDIANEIAPEHLELCVDNPFDYLEAIRNAGSVFLGKNCPEALGDYYAGPNHILPTGGTAKFSSPLSADDFVKKYQYTYYTNDALKAAAEDVIYFAEAEGLSAHARSISVRCTDKKASQVPLSIH